MRHRIDLRRKDFSLRGLRMQRLFEESTETVREFPASENRNIKARLLLPTAVVSIQPSITGAPILSAFNAGLSRSQDRNRRSRPQSPQHMKTQHLQKEHLIVTMAGAVAERL